MTRDELIDAYRRFAEGGEIMNEEIGWLIFSAALGIGALTFLYTVSVDGFRDLISARLKKETLVAKKGGTND